MEQQKEKTLKELVDESGFTVKYLAESVIEVSPNHLRAYLNGTKTLSPFREKILRDYLVKVSQVPSV